jgi:hypothetical protein
MFVDFVIEHRRPSKIDRVLLCQLLNDFRTAVFNYCYAVNGWWGFLPSGTTSLNVALGLKGVLLVQVRLLRSVKVLA